MRECWARCCEERQRAVGSGLPVWSSIMVAQDATALLFGVRESVSSLDFGPALGNPFLWLMPFRIQVRLLMSRGWVKSPSVAFYRAKSGASCAS